MEMKAPVCAEDEGKSNEKPIFLGYLCPFSRILVVQFSFEI